MAPIRDTLGRFAEHPHTAPETILPTPSLRETVARHFTPRYRTGGVNVAATVEVPVGPATTLTLISHEEGGQVRIVADIESRGEHLHVTEATFHDPRVRLLAAEVQTEAGCTPENLNELLRRTAR